jgi:hypothetical protein
MVMEDKVVIVFATSLKSTFGYIVNTKEVKAGSASKYDKHYYEMG